MDGRGQPVKRTRVHYKTFGCKANQYDTQRMRQHLEAGLAGDPPAALEDADLCVVNTCTVTNRADADARRYIRRIGRRNPGAKIVVAGCSAALRGREYRAMDGVSGVVEGHDPDEVLAAASSALGAGRARLLQLGARATLERTHMEGVGADVLRRRAGATRGWLKVQDGCDRKCAFCATRLARGRSRSRHPDQVVAEARVLARSHPELVVTGVHIGHYGRDLDPRVSLTALVRRLLDEVPGPRLRLGSIEATEIDDGMVDLLRTSGGRLAPHLHMPLQSGADPVLRRMRRWHTREQYRRRTLDIAGTVGRIGLGADIITGFPGETPEDHARTLSLVAELPFTYLHVFPYSPRDGTVAAGLSGAVPQRVSRERGRELRALAAEKGARHARGRGGAEVEVVMEGTGGTALTGDYLRVAVESPLRPDPMVLHRGRLSPDGTAVRIDAATSDTLN
ncbi:MAG: MiaB/RimO family radical SAM methylthiotransferase [Gemmatimonadetes bacterium]|nr:MiaB/RimO family radical SAM methylthiotransferase [Gemmatimonadota bacterium]MYH54361.1 MiaB/RimO family radical SAM methylthiotransferase [Gemmatimonadota bacterium]MYK67493.1 MiaB/RimO family radical SAM methylthiotransferase [Gemmatimonadota bacterium]